MDYREVFESEEYRYLYEGNERSRIWNRRVKYFYDIPTSVFGLIFASPLLLLSAIAIKLDSPGPIFYTPTRIGEDGKKINVYKFRTLREEGRETLEAHMERGYSSPREYDQEKEEYVTRVGRVLRKFSLDELPQLFNVLRGEMSLVGPRALHPLEVQNLPTKAKRDPPIEAYRRFTCPAGMVCTWQLNDDRYEVDRTELDIRYAETYNTQSILQQDLEVLVKTIPFMLLGKNR